MTREDLIMDLSAYEAEIYDLTDYGFSKDYLKGVQEAIEFVAGMHRSNDVDCYKSSQLYEYREMMQKVLDGIDEKYKLDR